MANRTVHEAAMNSSNLTLKVRPFRANREAGGTSRMPFSIAQRCAERSRKQKSAQPLLALLMYMRIITVARKTKLSSVSDMVSQAHPTNRQFQNLSNHAVAAALSEVARLLQRQSDNPFRIAAYRRAASQVQRMVRRVGDIYEESGIAALRDLPGVGDSLARSIAELLDTGELQLLDRLRKRAQGEPLLVTLPGVGAELARRIRATLSVATLEDLEAAAYDGRLRRVPGLGTKRIRAIRESLAARLQRMPDKSFRAAATPDQPPVGELLELDREYRRLAGERRLPQAAPRRFNPTGAAWLPVWHAERGVRRYALLYSNTARAHEAEATHDWVVIYRDDHAGAGQWTVITAELGPLHGRRIVRGREAECRDYYRDQTAQRKLPFCSDGSAQRSVSR